MAEYIGKELELFQLAKNWKAYFSSSLHKYISGKVLEVGAGIGTSSSYLVTKEATSWTFIEPDIKLAEKISDNTAGISIPKRIVTGTINDIQSEKFDTIIYIDVLEHIDKSREEIRKANDLLNPSGHLIILVPAFQLLFSRFDKDLGHFRRYNKTLLRNEVNGTLAENKLFYLDSCGFLASLTNRFLTKQPIIHAIQLKFWDNCLIPLSKITDIICFHKFGKSLVGIFEKNSRKTNE
jgi:SAM-dependent methyltransferase